MTIESVLSLLSAAGAHPWLLGTVMALRLAAAGINFAIAVHRGVRHFHTNSK